MDKLLPEFQKIVDDATSRTTIIDIVTRCQELALRRPEMSDAELLTAWNDAKEAWPGSIRAVLDTYEAKRFKPAARKVKHRNWLAHSGSVYCATEHLTDLNLPFPFDDNKLKWLGDIFEREVTL